MKNRFLKLAGIVSALSATLLLSACGGGGGGDDDSGPAPVQSRAEGVYEGRVTGQSTGEVTFIVLENDRFYALFGQRGTQNMLLVQSLIEGQGTSRNGSFTASSVREYANDGTVFNGSLSASYVPRVSVNGSITSGAVTASFTSAPVSTQTFNYDTPATLSAITGTWPGSDLSGEGVTFNINPNGGIVGVSQTGCNFTGTAAPRPSGKNVFDVTVNFGSANCGLPNMSVNGVGVITNLDVGGRQLIVALTNSGRNAGTVVFAARQS